VLVRKVLTVGGVALGLVLAVMAYALMHDLFDGLPFTRSTESWDVWAAGLFVGGLFLLLMEAAGEWLFGPNQPWEHRPRRTRRVLRIAVAALLVALVAVTVAVVSKQDLSGLAFRSAANVLPGASSHSRRRLLPVSQSQERLRQRDGLDVQSSR